MGSKTERIAKLEVRVDNLKEQVDEQCDRIDKNHDEVREDFKCVKKGQVDIQTKMGSLAVSLTGHLDTSRQRRAARWTWLKYLIFPILLAATVKFMDLILK